MAILKMGTRGSALALAQSSQAARALEKLHQGLTVETVVIKTTGDLFGAPSPEKAKLLPQGAKGLWVKELEEALLDGRVDFAAHSAKDLPATLLGGLSIAAYPEREDPRDCVVGKKWKELKAGSKVATSSLRRSLMVQAAIPGAVLLPLRGNLDTRLRKLAEGEFDAMIAAVAGLKRLGRGAEAKEPIDPAVMLPSPAQGALALEIRSDRKDVREIVRSLDHAPTRICVEFERAFLAEVGGGCGSPVGAYARLQSGGVVLEGFYAHEGATSGRRVAGHCADSSRREAFVKDLAAQATRK
ncbi:MAG: hydroxymethylbilane synthase [Elusimicrobia bacterium]|nr:hydroxymethylbilane synthase [Elusimicrobiota bacterium]